MKLLGTIISADLTWTNNTKLLIKKAYARMQILRKLYGFSVPIPDLVNIYIIYIRSILEVSCVVWSSAITHQEIASIERIQKIALRIILGDSYVCYDDALEITKLETLEKRREKLCLNFARSCLKNNISSSFFPLNPSTSEIETRDREKYHV